MNRHRLPSTYVERIALDSNGLIIINTPMGVCPVGQSVDSNLINCFLCGENTHTLRLRKHMTTHVIGVAGA